MMKNFLRLNLNILFVIIFFECICCGSGLKCYQCGFWGDSMSTVNPCFTISDDNLETCEGFCKRYDNKGVIVLSCSKECEESKTMTTKTTCCSEDGCNGATSLEGCRTTILLIVLFIISFLRL